jgi:hypothetical protein
MSCRPLYYIAYDWACRCFGSAHVHNQGVRSLRIAEEAVELCQAHGVPKDKMQDLVQIVYARPRGVAIQELGGLLMTTYIYCAANVVDPEEVFITELRRVLEKAPEHFAKRNQEKIDAGLDA